MYGSAVPSCSVDSSVKLFLFGEGDIRGRQRQVGSLAGAAHLLNDNTGVLR